MIGTGSFPKQYFKVFSYILFIILILFILINFAGIKLLTNPSDELSQGGFAASVISYLLLTGDIILPVPSSIIMITNGALFGITMGTLISLCGGLSASLLGFLIGGKGSKLINKLVNQSEQEKANNLIKKWGMVAIIITRPIPLLSETTSIMAGASNLGAGKMFIASVIGLLPASLVYAITGVYAVDFESGVVSFLIVILSAAIFWFVNKLIKEKLITKSEANL